MQLCETYRHIQEGNEKLRSQVKKKKKIKGGGGGIEKAQRREKRKLGNFWKIRWNFRETRRRTHVTKHRVLNRGFSESADSISNKPEVKQHPRKSTKQ